MPKNDLNLNKAKYKLAYFTFVVKSKVYKTLLYVMKHIKIF